MRLKGHIYLCYINDCIKKACKACGLKLDEEALDLDIYKAVSIINRTGNISIVGDIVYVDHLESYMKGRVKEEGVKYRLAGVFTYSMRKGLKISIYKIVAQGPIERNTVVRVEEFKVPISIDEALRKAYAHGGNEAVVKEFFGV